MVLFGLSTRNSLEILLFLLISLFKWQGDWGVLISSEIEHTMGQAMFEIKAFNNNTGL